MIKISQSFKIKSKRDSAEAQCTIHDETIIKVYVYTYIMQTIPNRITLLLHTTIVVMVHHMRPIHKLQNLGIHQNSDTVTDQSINKSCHHYQIAESNKTLKINK